MEIGGSRMECTLIGRSGWFEVPPIAACADPRQSPAHPVEADLLRCLARTVEAGAAHLSALG
jgi:hypothetical protein